jgi:outer membrane protein
MMSITRNLIPVSALAGLLLCSDVIHAQSGDDALPAAGQCLSFDDSLMLAATRAPEVDGAWARRSEALANLRTAESLRYPQLSTFGRSGVGDNGLTSSQIDNQIGLRLSQRVLDFGDARLARESALADLDRRGFDVQDQQIVAAITVATAYLARLEADAMIAVIRDRRGYFQRQQAAVGELLERGGATRAERAQIAAQLAEAEADVLELNFQASSATTRIVEYTGLNQVLCDQSAANATMTDRLRGLDSIDAVIDHALQHNPQIGARRSAIGSLEARRERERRARMPVVDVVGIVSYTYDNGREDWDLRDRVGVDVSVPLLSGDSIGAGQDRVAAQLSQEEYGLRALQRGLREEVEITFRRTISLEAQLIRREMVASSQGDYFDAISGEFEFGLGTLPDLIDARLAYERAMLDVVSARFSLLRQKLSLMRLTARIPLPEER